MTFWIVAYAALGLIWSGLLLWRLGPDPQATALATVAIALLALLAWPLMLVYLSSQLLRFLISQP